MFYSYRLFGDWITFSAISSSSLKMKIHLLKNEVKSSVSRYCKTVSHIVEFQLGRDRRRS